MPRDIDLRIKRLDLNIGIGLLGGHQSINVGPQAGRMCARSIERMKGGFVVEWPVGDGKFDLILVPDSTVLAAKVEMPESKDGKK
jgi:hypothetical protein